jgi:hypothetical protein
LKNKILFFVTAMLLYCGIAAAQLPVEVFAGDKKATGDIMFFRFFKNGEGVDSKFLFFNRNRVSIDYRMTDTTYLPQFGFTEAVSYNPKTLKGLAPVVVASINNKGLYPKAGIQYAKVDKKYTVFSWVVAETDHDPMIDFFLLLRYTPKLTEKSDLFTQLELLNVFPTASQNNYSFTQRLRLGLKRKVVQFGVGVDLNQSGRDNLAVTENTGGFIRYEF